MSEQSSVELPSEDRCAQLLREKRWKSSLKCVHCLSGEVVKNGVREDGVQQYRCKSCGSSFNDRTGTVFSETRMGLNECFYILNGMEEDSINGLSRDLGRSWKTVSDFVRAAEQDLNLSEIVEQASELNETDLQVDYSKFGCG